MTVTPFPKIVALDTDDTIWAGLLDERKWRSPDDIQPDGDHTIVHQAKRASPIKMHNDVPDIIADILKSGAQLAVVSRNKSKPNVERALYYFQVTDPRDGQKKPITSLITYLEVHNSRKNDFSDLTKDFCMSEIHRHSKTPYAEMVVFDDNITSDLLRFSKGVVVQVVNKQKGLTSADYQEGLETWRRLHAMRSPYLGQELQPYGEPMWIGFSGMDQDTINLLSTGQNRIDIEESARWGYAMYVADDIYVANYFASWIKADARFSSTQVCDIWVRDRRKWLETSKVWVPQFSLGGPYQVNVKSKNFKAIAENQASRDKWVAQRGVKLPYVLFSKHFKMPGMSRHVAPYFNEMVIPTHVQGAQLFIRPLTEPEVNHRLAEQGTNRYLKWEERVAEWNIVVPKEAEWEVKRKGLFF